MAVKHVSAGSSHQRTATSHAAGNVQRAGVEEEKREKTQRRR